MQLDDLLRRLKEARDFECLKDEPSHYVKAVAGQGAELAKSKQNQEDGTRRSHPLRCARGRTKNWKKRNRLCKKQVRDGPGRSSMKTQGELATLSQPA